MFPIPDFTSAPAWLVVLAIFAGTFIHEDLATVAAGILVAEGGSSIELALPTLYVGVMVGDLGLYAFGRLAARTRILSRFADGGRYRAVKAWFDERVVAKVFVVRFVPGLRMSAYATYGFFAMPFRRFILWDMLAVTVWTTGLFYLSYTFGKLTAHWLGVLQWPIIIGAAVIPLLFAKHLAQKVLPHDDKKQDKGTP